MRNGWLSMAILAALAATGTEAGAQGAPANLGVSVEVREEVLNSFIFVFKNDVPAAETGRRANALAGAHGGRVTHVYSAALKGFAAKMPDEVAARLLAQNPAIAYVEPDAIAYAFAKPSPGGGTPVPCGGAQETPWGITRVGGPVAGATHTAWVIDTGIDFEHPDLHVDVARSTSFLRTRSSADDGNGHGTHVAGTIGALDNGCGVVGVAPGATLVAVRVLDNSGSGSYSGVIKGIDYVAANGVQGDVANMSLGGPRNAALNDAVIQAAGQKGIYFALAAGNETDEAELYSPASAEGANIYTVSAIDSSDRFAWFSNYGNPPVDCAAPGVGVLSTRNGGGTTTLSGTSMAAPHVAGLLLAGLPSLVGAAIGDPDGAADPICHR